MRIHNQELKNKRAQVFQVLFLDSDPNVRSLSRWLWEAIYGERIHPKGEESLEGFHCPGCGRDVKDEENLCSECSTVKAEYLGER